MGRRLWRPAASVLEAGLERRRRVTGIMRLGGLRGCTRFRADLLCRRFKELVLRIGDRNLGPGPSLEWPFHWVHAPLHKDLLKLGEPLELGQGGGLVAYEPD